MNSARCVRNAMTSCLVTRSISSIRATSNSTWPACSQIARALALGIAPISASASQACASISNQMRNRVAGAQIAVISGRAYRGIIAFLSIEPRQNKTAASVRPDTAVKQTRVASEQIFGEHADRFELGERG